MPTSRADLIAYNRRKLINSLDELRTNANQEGLLFSSDNSTLHFTETLQNTTYSINIDTLAEIITDAQQRGHLPVTLPLTPSVQPHRTDGRPARP